MKTKERKRNSTIQELRTTRDKIGKDIQNMTLKELNEYLNKKKPLHPTLVADAQPSISSKNDFK